MPKIGSYDQQSVIDDSDKFPLEDGSSEEVKYAEFGDIRTRVNAAFDYTSVPALKAHRITSIQVLPTSGLTAIQWNGEVYKNTSGMHDNSTNPDRLIATKAGIYQFSFALNQSSPFGGGRVIIMTYRKSSAGTILEDQELFDDTVATGEPSRTVSFSFNMDVGDYVQIFVHPTANTGGADISSGSTIMNAVSMTYMAAV